MKTAEEFLLEKGYSENERIQIYGISQTMIEFAKYHVQKALEAVNENGESYVIGGLISRIDKDSIINAYPLKNIK